ncbi:MAG TPA: HAD-IIIA family hydrolase [Bacteroidia bacterium]|jgi:3-deoxy-D-manno-octulosonate 8-phosphate phosphatase (KDO 8-P phosphatase)|nr:HAD-IIIA family hydrolase [Bacteroidia bacterium]HMU18705.1 HAD-IIIA family hydrolase [Bacteroidia bacterium]
MNSVNFKEKLKEIKCFVFDVDGVLTNGMLHVTNDGKLLRAMNIKDGYALQLAVKKGYRVVIISGGKDEGVVIRLKNLGISDIYVGIGNKLQQLYSVMQEHHLTSAQLLYMGDDMPDAEAMKNCAIASCPYDAAPQIRDICHYISPIKGGEGCARDVIEQVLTLNNDWE